MFLDAVRPLEIEVPGPSRVEVGRGGDDEVPDYGAG